MKVEASLFNCHSTNEFLIFFGIARQFFTSGSDAVLLSFANDFIYFVFNFFNVLILIGRTKNLN